MWSLLTYIAPANVPVASVAEGSWSVEGVVATIPSGPPKVDSESPVPFFHMLERLKTTKREGWRRFGISQYELSHPRIRTEHRLS